MEDLIARLRTELANSFDIERELGGGGMSRVFLATDRSLGRRVVIKLLAPDLAAELNVERFAREARFAAQLQHPHIVPLLTTGTVAGLPYYTMPFVDGESLRDRFTRSGRLPVKDVVSVLRDMSKALSYAHEHGVIHRDVKPENILLVRGSAVVTDFGVAKAISASRTLPGGEALTRLGAAVGTPAYMAPEQAAGDTQTDHRADLYALGAVGYEALTGSPVFAGKSAYELVRAHLTEAPAPVRTRRADAPRILADLIDRCLAKAPRDRPPSAESVLATLEAVESGTESPVAQTPRRHLERWIGVATLALVMLAAGAFAWARGRGDDRSALITTVLVLSPKAEASASGQSAIAQMTSDAIAEGLARMTWTKLVTAETGAASASDHELAVRSSAGTVVAGQLYPLGDSVQLQLRVSDGRTGALVRMLPPVRIGRNPRIEDIRKAVDPALAVVGYVTHPVLGAAMIPAGGIPRFAAFRELADAMSTIMYRGDTADYFRTAGHLRAAFDADSSYHQALLWLAAHGVGSYRWPQLMENFRLASRDAQRTDLPRSPFEGALAQYAALGVGGSTGNRLASLRRLAALAPNSPFAETLYPALLDVNRPRESLAAMDSLYAERRLRGAVDEAAEATYWLRRAATLHYLRMPREELQATRRARAIDPSALRGVRAEFVALIANGRAAEVEQRVGEIEEASGSTAAFFDFAGDAYLWIGQEMQAHGDSVVGARMVRRAVAWFERRRPDELRSDHIRFRWALACYASGNHDRALALGRELHAEVPEDPRYLGMIGRVVALRKLAEAETVLRQLEAMPAEELGGASTYERAVMTALLGPRAEAVALLQEALRQGQGWSIRARLHWFPEWKIFRGDPIFDRLVTPQG